MVGGMLCKSDKPSLIIIIIMVGSDRESWRIMVGWMEVSMDGG